MQRAIVVMFYCLKDIKIFETNPFSFSKQKDLAYRRFFQKGLSMGYQTIFVPRRSDHIQGLHFRDGILYNKNGFVNYGKDFYAHAVFDKSISLDFPSPEISPRVLNHYDFKQFCASKIAMYELLSEFMPYSKPIYSQKDFHTAWDSMKTGDIYVLKPSSDFGGKNIVIGSKENIEKAIKNIEITSEYPYVLQEFVDTSQGITRLSNTTHDLRVAIVNGEMCFSHIRTPKKGSLLANVKMGGSIKEVHITSIPKVILNQVRKVQHIIDEGYDKPLYSIDCGIQQGKLSVFEINDQIGFPSNDMVGAEKFIDNIWDKIETDILSHA